MNVEELNKTQIILLTLLISFVTSIATGIVTVSLVNQAPPVVTETIHKVIEKTIERIVPGEQTATIIEKTTTVVMNNDNSVADAVEKNSESLVRIFSAPKSAIKFLTEEEETKQLSEEVIFTGLGVVLSKTGKIITDDNLSDTDIYFIFHNDIRIELEKEEFELNDNAVFLNAQIPDNAENISFKPITAGNSDKLKLGQSIVTLGGEKSDIVLTGIISNLMRDKIPVEVEKDSTEESEQGENTDENIEPEYKIITTEINTNLDTQLAMKLLINLDGEVIGVKIHPDFYTPINLIIQDLNKLNQALAGIVETKTEI